MIVTSGHSRVTDRKAVINYCVTNTLATLNLEQMKAFSLVILPIANHISVTIKDLEKLLTVLM